MLNSKLLNKQLNEIIESILDMTFVCLADGVRTLERTSNNNNHFIRVGT